MIWSPKANEAWHKGEPKAEMALVGYDFEGLKMPVGDKRWIACCGLEGMVQW